MQPEGFVSVTSRDVMCGGHSCCQLPHDWRVGGVAHLRCELGTWKPDASCSLTQSIMVPCHHRGQGYKFGNARGSHRDVRVHPTEVVKGVVHTFAKGNPIFRLGGECILHGAEDIPCPPESECHQPESTERRMPSCRASPPLGRWERVQDSEKAFCLMRG